MVERVGVVRVAGGGEQRALVAVRRALPDTSIHVRNARREPACRVVAPRPRGRFRAPPAERAMARDRLRHKGSGTGRTGRGTGHLPMRRRPFTQPHPGAIVAGTPQSAGGGEARPRLQAEASVSGLSSRVVSGAGGSSASGTTVAKAE